MKQNKIKWPVLPKNIFSILSVRKVTKIKYKIWNLKQKKVKIEKRFTKNFQKYNLQKSSKLNLHSSIEILQSLFSFYYFRKSE